MYKDYNDYELIDMISESNETAEQLIYEKYRPMVIMLANKYFDQVKDKGAEMSDLIQEGFIGLSQAIKGFRDNRDAQFKTFAHMCIERELKTYVTKINRQKHQTLNNAISLHAEIGDSSITVLDLLSDEEANPYHHVANKDSINQILNKLETELTDFEKQVFNLKMANFSYREIASILEKDPKAIDNSLQRIKTKVRKVLNSIDT